MIKVNVIEKKRPTGSGMISTTKGYEIIMDGHASEYHTPDGNIVCAAVSALTYNLIASIEKLTGAVIHTDEKDEGGLMYINISHCSEYSNILLDSWLVGIEGIADRYGCIEIVRKTKYAY